MCGLPYDDLWGLHGHGDEDKDNQSSHDEDDYNDRSVGTKTEP